MAKTLTVQQFKQVLPVKMRKSINQKLIDKINLTMEHPETLNILRENILSYTHVLNNGRFKLSSYINAVKYCSFKFMGDTNRSAYIRTFPDKYNQFIKDGVSEKDISSYYTAYNKTKLVYMIMEQAMIPTAILNADMFQDALNVQHSLMYDSKVSPKVRSDAANSLLISLKQSEKVKFELDIGINKGTIIEEYEAAMLLMVKKQQELMAAGGDLLSITNAPIKRITEPEPIDITPDPPADFSDTTPLKLVP